MRRTAEARSPGDGTPALSFRTDRVATLYFVRPLRRLGLARKGSRIPILMYHAISADSSCSSHPYFATETSPISFADQIKYLHDNGYRAITLPEAVTLLRSQPLDAGKCVVITFDDGYRDFYAQAFPILSRYGFRAHVYLPTTFIGREPQLFKGRACLTWPQVRELHDGGVIFGSHTVTHPQLHSLSIREIEREIRDSKDTIEHELGVGIDSFSYPYAFPEQDRGFMLTLRDMLEGEGYQQGVTTILGSLQSHQDRFFLRRLPANSYDDRALFQAKLDGDYDWLRSPQYVKKLMERRTRRHAGGKQRNSSSNSSHKGRSTSTCLSSTRCGNVPAIDRTEDRE